ncbi:TRAP transporter small permease [Thermodesulfobacteriota bacterium]
MESFAKIVHRVIMVCTAGGGAFLVGIMALTVANVISRLFGRAIAGSYEISELLIVVTVAFAIGYTAMMQRHITVKILVSRFSPRTQAIVGSISSILCLGIWAVIAWASIRVALEKTLAGEYSDLLEVPFFPFRSVWVFGLILLCLVFLIDLFKALSRGVNK